SLRAVAPPPAPTPEAEAQVEAAVRAAPAAKADEVRAFAAALAEEAAVARGERPPAEPQQLLRVVGGDIAPPGSFMHCVCIGNPQQWLCTGALIAPQVVLTAAHCGGDISRIAVGGQTMPLLGPGTRVVSVRRAVVHPQYRAHPWNENDINLIILNAPALVPPVPIATLAQIGAAREVEIVGFGYSDPNRPAGFGVKRRVTIALPPLIRTDPSEAFSTLEAHYGFHADYVFVF